MRDSMIAIRPRFGWGIAVALVSAATFGMSGALAKPLLLAGWSPATVVLLRVVGGAVVLSPIVLWSMRGRWNRLPSSLPQVATFGVVGVAGSQLAYFSAVEHLDVGVALLLEYFAVVLIVGWLWLVHGQRPDRLTTAGVVLAVLGLVFVLGLLSGVQVSGIGVLWALLAAVGLAVYFMMSAQQSHDSLPPIAFAAFGLFIGGTALGVAGLLGLVPMRVGALTVEVSGAMVGWWLPLVLLAIFAGAVAFWSGIAAARAVGARLASFLGLTEVLFAVTFAWFLLGEQPTAVQVLGGVLIVSGVVAVRVAELRKTDTPDVLAPRPEDERAALRK